MAKSPPEHPKDKTGLDASAKLTRAKLNKCSGDADLSKDKSGLESPLEFRRSWYVEGHIRSGVISSVLMQRYQRTVRQRYSSCKGPLSLKGHLGDEGLCSGGTKLNSIFITAEWTKCSKGSEPSLGEKWTLDQQKWSILLKETKDTFIRHRPEDLKEPETRAAQGKHEGIWGCTLLIPEKILSPHLPRLRKKSSPWKADRGHNTNDCYQLKKQIEEAVASGKLAHLVKDIHRNNQRNRNQGGNDVKVINMIRVEGRRKRPFEEEKSGMMNELTFPAIPQSQLTDEPIILEGIIEGNQV
ncbi:hypothetical protein Tco_1335318 [Tanacetum coccineum]